MEVYWFWSAIICGTLGALVGRAFGKSVLGAVLGALFGPLGLLVVLIVGLCSDGAESRRPVRPSASRAPAEVRVPCPHCREQVIKDAEVCPHCRLPIVWPEAPRRVVKVGGVVVKPRRRLVVKPKA